MIDTRTVHLSWMVRVPLTSPGAGFEIAVSIRPAGISFASPEARLGGLLPGVGAAEVLIGEARGRPPPRGALDEA